MGVRGMEGEYDGTFAKKKVSRSKEEKKSIRFDSNFIEKKNFKTFENNSSQILPSPLDLCYKRKKKSDL